MVRSVGQTRRTAASRTGLFAFVLFLGLFCFAVFAANGDKEYKEGQKAEDQHNWDEAFKFYQQALKQSPDDPRFLVATGRTRFNAAAKHVENGSKLVSLGSLKEALAEFEQASAIDPSNDAARQEISKTLALIDERKAAGQPEQGLLPKQSSELDTAQGPPVLKPLSQAPINLKITNESKVIFETIGKLAGINVLFDPDFVSKRITVELSAVSLSDALDQTALITKTFWKVLTSNTILVIPDTAVKRREQEEQVIKTFYLSNPISPQELTEAVTAIRTLLETRRIQQINSLNAIIIRDTPDRVAIAEKIIQDIDKAKPEVVVDVAVLEVRRDKSRQLGLYPTSGSSPGIQTAATYNPAGTSGTTGTTGTTGATGTTGSTTNLGNTIRLNNLGRISTSDYSITMPGASLNALMGDSNTKVLQRPEVRASDGQKATLRIGDRVPVATGSFQPGVGSTGVNPLVNTQFQYIDVGVNLDITPKVHSNNEISLKVRVEVSQVTGESNIGGISQPVIGQRIIDHDIRLKEGEVNILGGLIQTQTTKSLSGVPGLSQIPFLKYFFSNITDKVSEDEVLIVLTPHTIRRPDILPFNLKALDVGTEGDVHLRSEPTSPEQPAAATPTSSIMPPAGSTPGAIKIDALSLVEKTGQSFEVPITIENATQANSASFEISYNTGLMKLVRISSGGFLGKGGQPVAVVQRDNEDTGKTVVTLSRPPDVDGVSGSGTLAVLTFSADKAGTGSLGVAAISKVPSKVAQGQGTLATVTIQ